jgi:hypothetical protein
MPNQTTPCSRIGCQIASPRRALLYFFIMICCYLHRLAESRMPLPACGRAIGYEVGVAASLSYPPLEGSWRGRVDRGTKSEAVGVG